MNPERIKAAQAAGIKPLAPPPRPKLTYCRANVSRYGYTPCLRIAVDGDYYCYLHQGRHA